MMDRSFDYDAAADIPPDAYVTADDPIPRARRTDPDTSHAAAASVHQSAASQRDVIRTLLVASGPLTSDEVDEQLGWTDVAHRRMKELEAIGDAERVTGQTRPTRRGRQAECWRATLQAISSWKPRPSTPEHDHD